MKINYKGVYIEDISYVDAVRILRSLTRGGLQAEEREFNLTPEVEEAVEGKKRKNKPGAGGSNVGKEWSEEEITYLVKNPDQPMSEVLATGIFKDRVKQSVYGMRSNLKQKRRDKISKFAWDVLQKLSK